MKILLTLILLIFSFISLGQNRISGQLITNSLDTLDVFLIPKETNDEKLVYTEFEFSKEKKKMMASEVNSFSSNARFFIGFKPIGATKHVIAESVCSGVYKLYKATSPLGKETFYLTKDSKEFKLLPESGYIAILDEEILKEQSVEIKIEPSYSEYYFRNVLLSHDAAVSPNKYVYEKVNYNKSLVIGLVLGGGYNKSHFNVEDNPKMKIEGGFSNSIGLSLKINFAQNYFFNTGFIFNQTRFNPSGDVISMHSLQMPLMLQHSFFTESIPFKVEAGLVLNYLMRLRSNSRITFTEYRVQEVKIRFQIALIKPIEITEQYIIDLGISYMNTKMYAGIFYINFNPEDLFVKNNTLQLFVNMPLTKTSD